MDDGAVALAVGEKTTTTFSAVTGQLGEALETTKGAFDAEISADQNLPVESGAWVSSSNGQRSAVVSVNVAALLPIGSQVVTPLA